MSIGRHRNILDYTLLSLLRRRFKNAGIILVFSFVIFIAASALFLTYAFKREAVLILGQAPQLIVQKMTAGRHELIPVSLSAEIAKIPGVSSVEPRYWGYYYDGFTKANYTLITADGRLADGSNLLQGRLPNPDEKGAAALGQGVARGRLLGMDDDLSLFNAQGMHRNFRISGIFSTSSELLTADLIVISRRDFTELFSLPAGFATDLVVEVRNETEAPVVARKIRDRIPDSRPILRNEIIRTYDAVFGWRSGMILALFAGALVAFVILAWDKATGLSAEERREIGILKAIGWETSDILEMKFWEGMAISMTSFLIGCIAAYVHIFFFGAAVFTPALKGWSVIYPKFHLLPFVDPYQIATLLCLTVAPYIASTIIPSWKAAVTDPDAVMRG